MTVLAVQAVEEAEESRLIRQDYLGLFIGRRQMSPSTITMSSISNRIEQLVVSHDKWRATECLNLIPSENITSPRVRELLTSDMGHRYRADDNFYRGTRYMDELETLAEELACKVFHADWASLRPLSGHIADMIAVSTLTKPGDGVLMVGPNEGGYEGLGAPGGYTEYARVKNLFFPYDSEAMKIKSRETIGLIEKTRPKLVVFGQSYFLFPHPVKELHDTCKRVGARIVYDGSHVLGLIAGGSFQKPFTEGADLLLGSTHKSFFGPQGGIILGTRDVQEIVKDKQRPGLIDNAHWNRIAALSQALEEMQRVGPNYAKQIIANSKALASALDEYGVPVKCRDEGYTESHQVMLNITDQKEIEDFTKRLEDANLIVDRGIRLGTNELTRRGFKQKEFDHVAGLISEVYKRGDTSKVRKESIKLRKEFDEIKYT
jgi:glycine hydroxymethyltransferase